MVMNKKSGYGYGHNKKLLKVISGINKVENKEYKYYKDGLIKYEKEYKLNTSDLLKYKDKVNIAGVIKDEWLWLYYNYKKNGGNLKDINECY